MDTHTHTHRLLCIEVSCHVVDVEGGCLLRWVMCALIGSASQYVTASIQDARLRWTAGRGSGVHLCSPFIRSVRWWIAADYRWRWRWFISVILHAVDTQQSLISPQPAIYCPRWKITSPGRAVNVNENGELPPDNLLVLNSFSVKLSVAYGLSINTISANDLVICNLNKYKW